MEKIIEIIAGSRLYGTATQFSDSDYRFIFLNDTVEHTVGLGKYEVQVENIKIEDSQGWELRKFFSTLQKTNSQAIEILFANESVFKQLDPRFKKLVINQRPRFIDTERMHKSLTGYIKSEIPLIFGKVSGELGAKRKESIEKYGYSYRNLVHAVRLGFCGAKFFESKGTNYPVHLDVDYPEFAELLRFWKTHPQTVNPEEVEDIVNAHADKMNEAFDALKPEDHLKFDFDYANRVLLEFYQPVIKKLHDKHGIKEEELLLPLQQTQVTTA